MVHDPDEYKYQWLEPIDPTEYSRMLGGLLGGDPKTPFVQPPSSQILTHCWQEFLNAYKSGDYRPEWGALQSLLEEAEKKRESNRLVKDCGMFFQLGQLCGKLSMPSDKQYRDGLTARMKNSKREWPLVKQNIYKQSCRKIAQDLARYLWEQDAVKSIRVADMANEVWAKMFELNGPKEVMACLPDRPEGIKPWIRIVAPAYARQPGAPKRKK